MTTLEDSKNTREYTFIAQQSSHLILILGYQDTISSNLDYRVLVERRHNLPYINILTVREHS